MEIKHMGNLFKKKDYEDNAISNAYDILAVQYLKIVKSEKLDNHFLETFLSNFNKGNHILDAGCGTGHIAEKLANKYSLNVTAIDMSPAMIELAQKNKHITVQKMDIRDLKFPEQTFDGIIANYSIIHLEEDEVLETLQGFNKVLKPEGLLYLSLQEPTSKEQKDGYYPVIYNKKVKLFINLFTEEEISTYLKKVQFSILWKKRREADKKTEFPFNKLFIVAQKKNTPEQ